MKHFVPFLIVLGIAVIVLTIYLKNIPQAISTPTPTASPTQSPTPTPKATPTKSPTSKPSTTPKPSSSSTPAPVVTSNQLPKSGYSSFRVATDVGTFLIDIGVGDISSTRVVIDTASTSDCTSNCPALSLGTYISRRNAFAGINGTYFCPAEPAYSDCGANNSFNFLVMNVDKYYFNSSNNVYSNNPGAIFSQSYVRFVGSISEWGRDTSPDGVISNYPLLVAGGNINFSGNGDSKLNSKAARSFVANKGNLVYIGVVFSASVSDVAHVLHTLGVDNALNLDDGGSTALWYGGYKVGPGRNIPNAILFISR